MFISTDTTIVINLKDLSEKQKNQLTYLPLNEGNKWIYRKISTHRDGMYNITARDTMNTNLIIDKETDGIYSTDQNTFITYHDQNKQIYIKKDLNSGQINIGYRIYFLFGEVGETIKINEQYSALRILSEEEVVWNSFETMRKAFKIYHAWDEETIYFLQGIGINRIVYEDEYNKSEFDLLAWEIDGIAYGDTTLLK